MECASHRQFVSVSPLLIGDWFVRVLFTSFSRVLWYPTQAKRRLEWGTQRLLLVQEVGVKAAVSLTP
jgi:hypothetical protein